MLLKLLQRRVRRPCAVLKFDASCDIFAGRNHCLIILAGSHDDLLENIMNRQAVYQVEVVDGSMVSFNNNSKTSHQHRDLDGFILVQPKLTYELRLVGSLAIWGPQNTPRRRQPPESWLHLGRISGETGGLLLADPFPREVPTKQWRMLGRHARFILLNPSFAPRSVGISCDPCAGIFSSVFSRKMWWR